jgi:hypothetical protein
MSVYLCYFLNPDGSVPLFDSIEAASEDEALARGARLLSFAPERAGLELWRDSRRITTLLPEIAPTV